MKLPYDIPATITFSRVASFYGNTKGRLPALAAIKGYRIGDSSGEGKIYFYGIQEQYEKVNSSDNRINAIAENKKYPLEIAKFSLNIYIYNNSSHAKKGGHWDIEGTTNYIFSVNKSNLINNLINDMNPEYWKIHKFGSNNEFSAEWFGFRKMNLISIKALKYSDSSFEFVDNNDNLYKAAYNTKFSNFKTQIFLNNIKQLKDYNHNLFTNSCAKSDKEIVETYPLISFRKAYLEKRYNNTPPRLKPWLAKGMNVNGSWIRGWGQFFKELKNMSRGDEDIEFIISGEVSPGGALKNCSVANVSPKLQSFICAIMAQEGNFDKPGRVQGLRWRQRMVFPNY